MLRFFSLIVAVVVVVVVDFSFGYSTVHSLVVIMLLFFREIFKLDWALDD